MVTTIEIEDELMEKLETLAKARAVSSRELISALLASGLKQIETRPVQETLPVQSRFKQKSVDFGVHIETPWTLLAELESEEYIGKSARK